MTMFLVETGLPYRIVPVSLSRGEQFRPEFLAISPNNKFPALIDHDPPGGGAALSDDARRVLFGQAASVQP